MADARRLPIGAELNARGASFRVWAPAADALSLVLLDGRTFVMRPEPEGYYTLDVAGLRHGDRYWLRPGDGPLLPDPVSRAQPAGPLGPSMLVDGRSFAWSDAAWTGLHRQGQVICEVHVGTFTPAGTFRSAIERLPCIADMGITAIELMPVNEFPGTFGWGYDCVGLYAPYHCYGAPDDLRAFVDAAHGLGLGVILDVVYNHLGRGGEFLEHFSATYYSQRYLTDWGKALNFDGEGSGPVREWVVCNGRYWVEEFHIDGFRIDATQNIYDFDLGQEHILAEFARTVRAAAGPRGLYIVGENEPQDASLVRARQEGGHDFDAVWNDDFHHSARVSLTGRNEAYFTDYRGGPQEFVSLAKRGFLYQGQRYRWQNQPRGTPTAGLQAMSFITFLQNHDQLANSGLGQRLHRLAAPGRFRALTALLLLGPGTPMLFQGQEFAASAPFLYFADYEGGTAEAVDSGRKAEVSQFPSLATPAMQAAIPRPDDRSTFGRCKLDWSERDANASQLRLHRDLIRLRNEDLVLNHARAEGAVDGAVLSAEAFCLRFFGANGDDRLLLINLGLTLELTVMPEPLLAPPLGHDWSLAWSSEDPAYGGSGTAELRVDRPWNVPGQAALLLRPGPTTARHRTALEKALEQAERLRTAGA
jgi:maltooligosyltrehalose trehalohydrolase